MIWFTRKNVVSIGKEKIEIKPVKLEAAIKLVLILGRYIPLLESKWPEFEAALSNTTGKRPEILSALIHSLSGDMQRSPGDMMQVLSLLTDKPIEWVAKNVTAQDFLKALPVIDKVNRFDKIFMVAKTVVRFEYG